MSRDGHIYFLTKNNNYSKNIFIYHNHHHDPQDTIYYTLRAQNYPGEQKQCIWCIIIEVGLSHDWGTQEVPPQEVQPSRTFWGGTSWYLPYILTDYNYQTLESSPVDEVTSAYRQIVTSVIFVMKSQQVWEEGM